MNNKAHLRPKDFDSNGDIIPMACKEEKGDCISREALKAEIQKEIPLASFFKGCQEGLERALNIIDNAPTVEPEITNDDIQLAIKTGFNDGYEMAKAKFERPQGEWIVFYTPKKKKVFKCDKCVAVSIQGQTNFCPNCGAKMKKGGVE